MLAQNFKTPADLDITDAEFDALVKVLGMLERGELVHTLEKHKPNQPFGFNMSWSGTKTECGTVACIGGWVSYLMGHTDYQASRYVNRPPGALMALYWPPGRLDDITPAQAAIALRSYLTHGEPRWDEALTSAQGQ